MKVIKVATKTTQIYHLNDSKCYLKRYNRIYLQTMKPVPCASLCTCRIGVCEASPEILDLQSREVDEDSVQN